MLLHCNGTFHTSLSSHLKRCAKPSVGHCCPAPESFLISCWDRAQKEVLTMPTAGMQGSWRPGSAPRADGWVDSRQMCTFRAAAPS